MMTFTTYYETRRTLRQNYKPNLIGIEKHDGGDVYCVSKFEIFFFSLTLEKVPKHG